MQGYNYLVFLSILATCSCIATPKQKPTGDFGWVLVCEPNWEAGISCGLTENPNSRNCEYNCGCTSDGEVTCEKDFGKCPSGQYSAICGGSPFSPCKCEPTVDKLSGVIDAPSTSGKPVMPAEDVLVCKTDYESFATCDGEPIRGKACLRRCKCDEYGDVVCPELADCSALFYAIICRDPCECKTLGDGYSYTTNENL